MFFEPERANSAEELAGLGLRRSPVTALVVPRPIGWISTLSRSGVANLAPFSFFNMVSQRPATVVFCANGSHAEGGDKDSLQNARDTGEFVVNLATWDLRHEMNDSSATAARAADEFAITGLTKAACRIVKPPRVVESPINLECRVVKIVDLLADDSTGSRNTAAFGKVVGVHIDARLIVDGIVDVAKARPLARLGYLDYATLSDVFVMPRPR